MPLYREDRFSENTFSTQDIFQAGSSNRGNGGVGAVWWQRDGHVVYVLGCRVVQPAARVMVDSLRRRHARHGATITNALQVINNVSSRGSMFCIIGMPRHRAVIANTVL